jgi:hypothetical protein
VESLLPTHRDETAMDGAPVRSGLIQESRQRLKQIPSDDKHKGNCKCRVAFEV